MVTLMKQRWIVMGGLFAIVIAGAGFAWYRIAKPLEGTNAAIQALRACFDQRDFISCARPIVHDELDRRDTSSLIADVVALELPQNQCHYALHVVGADLLRRYDSFEEAIRTCTHDCNSACQHGLIGEAFMDALGFEQGDVGSAHMTGEELRAMGHDLCAREPNGTLLNEAVRGTCHGLGHALYLAYQDFAPAAQGCRDSAEGPMLDACVRGVYMEYTDLLSARSAWRSMYDLPDYYSLDEIESLCDVADPHQAAACYYYFPIAVRQTYRFHGIDLTREEATERTQAICASRPDPVHRRLCFVGYGVTLYGTLMSDEAEATRICGQFEAQDRDACMAGMVSLVVEYGDEDRALSYCAQQADPLRGECYRIVFERVWTLADRFVENTLKRCPDGDVECIESGEAAQAGGLKKYFMLDASL